MADEKPLDLQSIPQSLIGNDPQTQSFAYQLEFLKLEYGAINEIVKRIDEMTQKNKEWAILIWAGSVSLAISQSGLRRYALLTAILPVLFWFIDAWWRRIQRSCIFRVQKISEFLNGPNLAESFREKKLIDFYIVDPRGSKYRNDLEYKKFTSVFKTMLYFEVGGFYFGLTLLSIALGLFFYFRPQ